MIRKLLLIGLFGAAGYLFLGGREALFAPATEAVTASAPAGRDASRETFRPATQDAFARAFAERRGGEQLQGAGIVSRVLADDVQGSRHQRFVVELPSGQTLLIAHNIDLAPRVAGLRPGDRVEFNGEYEWNAQGGVLHWTHRDPQGRHVAGYVRHGGRTYQ